MSKLEGVDVGDLQAALEEAEDAKATKRLMVALDYKDGEPVSVIADRYGIPQSTVYYWLDRFEERSLADAASDDDRPGRPSELSEAQRTELADTIAEPPAESGYDASEWTPELAREHVEETYDVEYSLGHVRRLLREISRYL